MPEDQAKFDGWAIVEVMGHQKFAGRVTTEAYGGTVLFRVDVPALPEREEVADRNHCIGGTYYPAGCRVKADAVPPFTKLFGASSIYCITPCTEEAAVAAVEAMISRPLHLLSLPPVAALQAESMDDVRECLKAIEDEDLF